VESVGMDSRPGLHLTFDGLGASKGGILLVSGGVILTRTPDAPARTFFFSGAGFGIPVAESGWFVGLLLSPVFGVWYPLFPPYQPPPPEPPLPPSVAAVIALPGELLLVGEV